MSVELKLGYKQTEVGEIPEDWDVRPIGGLQPFVTSGSRGWGEHAKPGEAVKPILSLIFEMTENKCFPLSLPSSQ